MPTFFDFNEKPDMSFLGLKPDPDYDPNKVEIVLPQFRPNLQKTNIPDGLFASCLTWLHSFFNIYPIRYPFEYTGKKPEEYSKHATCVPMEVPYLDAETLIGMTKTCESVSERVSTYRVRNDLIVKVNGGFHSPYVESLNLLMVRTLTTIPVPQVHQLTVKDDTSYLAMENIAGRTLHDCWDKLSIFRQFYIAWRLRGYVK
ncbi:hypothetical protein C8Q75DRAFT_894953 [Abortiporus biennis]|nr:hypothetical protein C8Q75DRAFT_894953 [Abortiporus biennis]